MLVQLLFKSANCRKYPFLMVSVLQYLLFFFPSWVSFQSLTLWLFCYESWMFVDYCLCSYPFHRMCRFLWKDFHYDSFTHKVSFSEPNADLKQRSLPEFSAPCSCQCPATPALSCNILWPIEGKENISCSTTYHGAVTTEVQRGCLWRLCLVMVQPSSRRQA